MAQSGLGKIFCNNGYWQKSWGLIQHHSFEHLDQFTPIITRPFFENIVPTRRSTILTLGAKATKTLLNCWLSHESSIPVKFAGLILGDLLLPDKQFWVNPIPRLPYCIWCFMQMTNKYNRGSFSSSSLSPGTDCPERLAVLGARAEDGGLFVGIPPLGVGADKVTRGVRRHSSAGFKSLTFWARNASRSDISFNNFSLSWKLNDGKIDQWHKICWSKGWLQDKMWECKLVGTGLGIHARARSLHFKATLGILQLKKNIFKLVQVDFKRIKSNLNPMSFFAGLVSFTREGSASRKQGGVIKIYTCMHEYARYHMILKTMFKYPAVCLHEVRAVGIPWPRPDSSSFSCFSSA